MTQNPNTDPGSGPRSSPGPQGRESAYFWRFSNRVWLKLLSEERRPVKQRDRPLPQPPARPPYGHKCVRAVSSAAAGADSYLSRCSRCPGAILHRVPSHKSHRSLRRVSRQINALRSQLRRFPLSTGNTGAPAPRAQPVANKAGGSGGAPAGNDELCVCLCRQLRTCAVKPQRAPLFPNLSKIKRR